MQYTEIFRTVKTDKIQFKNSNIFLVFVQNMHFGYMLEGHMINRVINLWSCDSYDMKFIV